MKKYDFDKVINRRGTNSAKWDCDVRAKVGNVDYPVGELLPLWVADMDFESAPEIREALAERVRHGIFGYSIVPDSCYDAIIRWEEKRHGWRMEKEWLVFAPGAVHAAHMAIQAYCRPGDRVVIQRPVYYPFFRAILNNEAHIANNPLREVCSGTYEIDFDDFERRGREDRTGPFIPCRPHNPGGRVWRPRAPG
ncbi:MAG: aminotransferase class I/II-fold pyridoxal phosphate-dependent enzyme, partial [Synergistaceae bacterium]|nr:aminotransferase class I/II-fold pyridoxal phosphate-dependent enzyme [Synergistaceae bacterium]